MTHFQPQQKILSSLKKKKPPRNGSMARDLEPWFHTLRDHLLCGPRSSGAVPIIIQAHESRALCRYCRYSCTNKILNLVPRGAAPGVWPTVLPAGGPGGGRQAPPTRTLGPVSSSSWQACRSSRRRCCRPPSHPTGHILQDMGDSRGTQPTLFLQKPLPIPAGPI